MKNRITATRNTCFAIISAIESDLRTYIVQECDLRGLSDILPDDIRELATRRWQADHSSSAQVRPEDDFELIDYTDFLDLAKLLHRTVNKVATETGSTIRVVSAGLERMTPVRNRVCHSRPLEPEDLPSCIDLSKQFVQVPGIEFTELTRILALLNRDPNFVLGIQIPAFWVAEKASIHHNLPLTEFDETGFLGRRKDRQELHRLLRSHYPVVTVIGEGGVGKTALALRCLYDLLDDDNSPYDAIIWSSLKMTALTDGGVVQLNNDVTTTLGLLGSVADSLGTPSFGGLNVDELIDEIGQYLDQYRVLLAIDNLETLASVSLRDLLLKIPQHSKLLITSRVGIGEFEARYSLESLDMPTSVELMRRFARVLGVTTIYQAPDSVLHRYAQGLFKNPLLLKWFISGIARGLDPKSLLDRGGSDFQAVLDFCLANVFDKLDEPERNVVDTLVLARRPLTAAEIYFLNSGVEQVGIEWTLSSLHNSSILKRLVSSDGTFSYHLSEPASLYVSSNEAPSRKRFNAAQSRMRDLNRMAEREGVAQARYPYEIFSVRASSRDERIAAVLLSQALDSNRHKRDLEGARSKIEEAKHLFPTFGEVYRISSLVESAADEPYRASEELDRAVNCDPKSTITRYTYAQFLIRQLEDFEGALKHIEFAENIDPASSTLKSTKALALNRLGRSAEAASLYENVLENVDNSPRRWRITIRDQTADCYRRWAELDLKNRDFPGFTEHITKALDHLSQAIEHSDFDDRTVRQLGRVIKDGVVAMGNEGDFATAASFIGRIEKIVKRLPRQMVDIKDSEYIARALQERQDLVDRVTAVTSVGRSIRYVGSVKPDSKSKALGTSGSGWIDYLPSGVRYGFIREQDGNRLFFHYDSLKSKDDRTKLSLGAEVRFTVGKNNQGVCAVAVTLVSSPTE